MWPGRGGPAVLDPGRGGGPARPAGQARFGVVACRTCMQRSGVHYSVERAEGVVAVLDREIGRARGHREEKARLDAELDAIVALITAHREEFDTYLTDRAGTVSLADVRRQKRTGEDDHHALQ